MEIARLHNDPSCIKRPAIAGENNPNWKGGVSVKKYECKHCGKKVEKQTCSTGLFCDVDCYTAYRESRRKNAICVTCGKSFEHKPSISPKYCSNECRYIGVAKRNTGEGSPTWRGGISFEPYPVSWSNDVRAKVRDRDDHTCQICGKPESEDSRKIAVHHINYDKNDLEEFNLISLCCSCHCKTNYNREYWFAELMDVMAFNMIGERCASN